MLRFLFAFTFLLSSPSLHYAQGILDLRNLEQDKVVDLQTHWQFCFDDFLSARQMEAQKKKAYQKIPDSWTGNEWKGEEMPAHGHATYFLKVLLPPSFDDLAIKVPPLGTASKLIINDSVLFEVGKISRSEEQAVPRYQDMIAKIPEHNGELNIIFHISNYHYRKGGLWQVPTMGSVDAIYRFKTKKYQLEFFVFGSILFMGFYHFGLYLFGFRNKLNIVFGSICLVAAIRAASVGQYVLVDLFPSIPWRLLVSIEYISYFMFIILTLVFIWGLFEKIFPMLILKTIGSIFIALIAFTIVLPVNLSSYLIPFAQLVTVVSALFCFYIIGRASTRKDTEAIIFMIGLSVLTLALINDSLFYSNIILTGSFFSFGLMLYFVTHSMILAKRFSYAFFEVKRLTLKLQANNATLEKKVSQRTKKIENQNDQLVAKNEELEKLHVEKDGLISIIAHDLKAPFNRSKGLLNLIRSSGPVTKDQEEVINMIDRSTDQGFELISDLLLLYGEKQLTHKKELVNLNNLLKETSQAYKKLASAKHIKLKLELVKEPIMLRTDPGLLSRVLDNLLTNAIKFSQSEKKIYLRLVTDTTYVFVSVKDEGPGIPEGEQHLLFKQFQKLTPQPTGGETSTGLGLSIVKQIMEELSGTIEVKSKPGQGSEFILKFDTWE